MPKTKTSNFGISKRENHDSSLFYNKKLYSNYKTTEETTIAEHPIPKELLNKIYCEDSRKLPFLPNNSIHLVVTSPPYNVSKVYDEDLSLDEYLEFIKAVMTEMHRILIRGGRICLNIANIGRKPYIPLNSYINMLMIGIGFLMRGEIIWNKSASAGISTAWGSWQSATNPTLRDVHEYILVYSKEQFSRLKNEKEDTIQKEDFLEFTKSIWTFPTESAKKVGHPAPFPVELPQRCIELYSLKGDIVLDPFNGSGSTCIAASKVNRKFIGIDINKEYCDFAQKRIYSELQHKSLEEFI